MSCFKNQFSFAVRGTKQRRVPSSSFKKKWFTINGTQSTLLSNKADIRWFPSYTYIRSFLTYGKNYRVFQANLFDKISKIFNIAFWSVWKVFFPVILRFLAKKYVRASSTLVLILSFEKTSKLFLFFVVSFLFVLTFFACCYKTNVYNYRRYQTLRWKCSNFFKWAAFGYINTEPIILIFSYIWKVSLFIFITLSPENLINYILYSTLLWFSMLNLIVSGNSKAGFSFS